MRRIAALVLVLLLLTPSARGSESFAVGARSAALIEAGTGRVLYAQNADEAYPMASTTKIMTCLLALENAALDEPVTAGPGASGVPGTSIYLSPGETLTMEQMLYGLMLRSGNDAAVAIAEHVSGSAEAFAALMNARAAQLGANAHFVNPHGLDAEGHRASALGLARIMREGLKNETFAAITATRKKIIPWADSEFSRVLENKNRLLKTYEGATGGKTGFTSHAGRCLVFSAKRGDMQLIGAVLNCPTWFDTAAALLDYGFERYRLERPVEAGQALLEAAVAGGQAKRVRVAALEGLSAPVGEGERYSVRYEVAEDLRAPLTRGQRVGRAVLEVGGEALDECALVTTEAVERFSLLSALRQALRGWALRFGEM